MLAPWMIVLVGHIWVDGGSTLEAFGNGSQLRALPVASPSGYTVSSSPQYSSAGQGSTTVTNDPDTQGGMMTVFNATAQMLTVLWANPGHAEGIAERV